MKKVLMPVHLNVSLWLLISVNTGMEKFCMRSFSYPEGSSKSPFLLCGEDPKFLSAEVDH